MPTVRSSLPANCPGAAVHSFAAPINPRYPFLALCRRFVSIQKRHHAPAARLLLAGVLLLFTAAQVALATPYEFIVDKNVFFNQISGSQPTAAASEQFGAQIFGNNNLTAATLTPPGGSPISMMGGGGTFHLPFSVNTYFTSQSQLDAAFPDGNYSYGVTINSSNDTASLTMPDNTFYPTTVPFLTSASFSALQSYNPTQSLQLSWNSFVPDPRTTFPFVDFFIQDESTIAPAVFVSDTSTNVSSFTSTTIPVGTLLPDHNYLAVLVFENDAATTNAYFGDYDTDAEKEYFTDIRFTTTPEPSSLVLLCAGAAVALLAYGMRFRNARGARHAMLVKLRHQLAESSNAARHVAP
jgi:hypothetical protein